MSRGDNPTAARSAPGIGPGEYADMLGEALLRLCGPLDAETMASLLSHIELVHLEVGDRLYRQGESDNSMHIVLTGRLKVEVRQENGDSRVLAHPQPGEVVGEMAWLTGAPRAATVQAVRDTTLGMLQREDLDLLIAKHPEVFSRIARMIIGRLSSAQSRVHGHIGQRPGVRTIMLVPIHDSIPRAEFSRGLRQALLRFGSVLQLDSRAAAARLAAGGESGEGAASYGRFLDDCERNHDFVILEADAAPSPWTRRCYGYADRIILVADATRPPEPTPLERWLIEEQDRLGTQQGAYAEVELVLLHRGTDLPQNTRSWLAPRQVARHHHLRGGPRIDRADLARLARFLSSNTVALVLAGGGARGFAHLGVIRALHEAGIPIDAVGGTSFGALAATGIARALSDEQIIEEQRIAFTRDDPLGDYTLPLISMVRGERLDRVLHKYLPMDIEDLWLPFFAVSSDLTTNRVRVHDRGQLWRAIRASVSLPAILPPALEDGHLLIDGGVLNNLPVDIMRERMRGHLIAVDLAVEQEYKLEGPAVPGVLEYLQSRLLPRRKPIQAPTVSQVIMKLTTLASRKEMENIHRQADLYLNPQLDAYDFMDWGKLREIVDLGYAYALPRVEAWARARPALVDATSVVGAWLKGHNAVLAAKPARTG